MHTTREQHHAAMLDTHMELVRLLVTTAVDEMEGDEGDISRLLANIMAGQVQLQVLTTLGDFPAVHVIALDGHGSTRELFRLAAAPVATN